MKQNSTILFHASILDLWCIKCSVALQIKYPTLFPYLEIRGLELEALDYLLSASWECKCIPYVVTARGSF